MEQEIYRVNDFCKHFSISRSAFYREVRANRLSILRRGCRTFVSRRDAEAWIERQRQGCGAQESYTTSNPNYA
jgi:hypothetical protein